MNKAQAKAAVAALAAAPSPLLPSDVSRANTLIDTPNAVNQYYFGTCGMAAVLRSYLQYDLDRFVQLMQAVFAGADFNGIKTGGPGVLLNKLVKKRDAKLDQVALDAPSELYDPVYDLDFLLARSLGKLLKIRSPYMYQAQKLFSEEIAKLFNVKDSYLDLFTIDPKHVTTLQAGRIDTDLRFELSIKDWMLKNVAGFGIDLDHAAVTVVAPGSEWVLSFDYAERRRVLRILRQPTGELLVVLDVRMSESAFRDQGDLGLDSDGLKTLMLQVAGAPTATITKLPAGNPQPAVDAINAQLTGEKPFAYGLIRSYGDWHRASKQASSVFTNPPTAPAPIWGRPSPEGEHIVAVNGVIRQEGGSYVVPVWSWQASFEVKIPAARLAGYLPTVVHGRIAA
jgi:hypothetical protein